MDSLERYYLDQAGGGGKYYIGRHQRGHGIGSLFATLFRTALPFIKSGAKIGAKAIGQHVLKKASEKLVSATSQPKRRPNPSKRRRKIGHTATKIKRLI